MIPVYHAIQNEKGLVFCMVVAVNIMQDQLKWNASSQEGVDWSRPTTRMVHRLPLEASIIKTVFLWVDW